MEKNEILGAVFVASGTACTVAAVLAAVGLDGVYVLWSALTLSDRVGPESAAGAPVSILSPILIWSAVALGAVLITLGLRVSLRKSTGNLAIEPRDRDAAAVDETIRAWKRPR
jgi:hypothetical protein